MDNCRRQSGQALIEFMLCLPFFLLLIGLMIYFAEGLFARGQCALALRYAARRSAINEDAASGYGRATEIRFLGREGGYAKMPFLSEHSWKAFRSGRADKKGPGWGTDPQSTKPPKAGFLSFSIPKLEGRQRAEVVYRFAPDGMKILPATEMTRHIEYLMGTWKMPNGLIDSLRSFGSITGN